MKRLFTFLIVLFVGLSLNAKQPTDTLRILGIGNSFTDDGMMYLPELLEAAGIHNVVLGRLYIGGCSLERHWNEYINETPNYKYYRSDKNKWVTVSNNATMMQVLTDDKWDIVVLQQQSSLAGLYVTFQPWLNDLMDVIHKKCPNPDAEIAWQETWSYAPGSTNPGFVRFDKDRDLMYKALVEACRHMVEVTSIRLVIPTGDALHILRENTSELDSLQFTRDGYHLDLRMGRYTAACAWFETLIAPYFNISVSGNSCRLSGTVHELTAPEAKSCQEAVIQAGTLCIENFGKRVKRCRK